MENERKRDPSIEALRIISILLIISFHYVYKGGFTGEISWFNWYIIKIFWMFGELGVNCFMLITGYFMVEGRFKLRKLILIWIQIETYNIVVMLIAYKIGILHWAGKRAFILQLLPIWQGAWWFMTAYMIIYILSPFMKRFAKSISKHDYIKFLMVCLMLWSMIPTVLGVFRNDTEGSLYYTRAVWLIVIWFTGGYLRLYGHQCVGPIRSWKRVFFITLTIIFGSIWAIKHFSVFFAWLGTTEPAYLWRPNTTPMYVLSVSLFCIFLDMKLPYLRAIDRAATTTLGIYLLHDSVLAGYIWGGIFKNSSYAYSPFLIVHIVVVTMAIFLIGMGIDLIRQCLEKWTVSKWVDMLLETNHCKRIREKILRVINALERV